MEVKTLIEQLKFDLEYAKKLYPKWTDEAELFRVLTSHIERVEDLATKLQKLAIKEDTKALDDKKDSAACFREVLALLGVGKTQEEHCINPHEIIYRGCTKKCRFFLDCKAIEKKEVQNKNGT